ncbi:MAG: undecaprenyl-diphosphate phosphatase [Candidatus Yanofskybacteria bacterium]|nr:undecaprenyl-diphosphate phosphatase [Candidatus Yanofskybacteria bacterium]
MDLFSSFILSAVEGFTEFLPISSTAHLWLTAKLLGLPNSDFMKTFGISIQSGAILAVLALYWRKLLDYRILKKLFTAFLPTGILGLIFYKTIKTHFIGNDLINLSALAAGGVFLILFEKLHQEKDEIKEVESISYKNSFLIGLFQSVAMIPGVSRAAATIVGGLFLKIRRATIVEFSFLLAVPTMLAATGFELVKNLDSLSSSQFGTVGIGFVLSFVMALSGIKFLLSYIKTRTFTGFGVYRIILAAVFALLFYLK